MEGQLRSIQFCLSAKSGIRSPSSRALKAQVGEYQQQLHARGKGAFNVDDFLGRSLVGVLLMNTVHPCPYQRVLFRAEPRPRLSSFEGK